MEEHWETIQYNEKYQISNFGNVKGPRCVLKQQKTNGYPVVYIRDAAGNNKKFKVHRLVGEYFIEKVDGCDSINHIDGDKTNNRQTNLEWVTPKANSQHAVDNQLFGKRRKTLSDYEFGLMKEYYINNNVSYSDVAEKFGYSLRTIERLKLKQYKLC